MNAANPKRCLLLGTAALTLAASAISSRANIVIDTFDSASEVSMYSFGSWQGSPSGAAAFSTNDANTNASSGSMQLQLTYGSGQNGGSFVSSAAALDASSVTNIEFDLMVDPASPVDPNGNVFYFQMGFNSPANQNPVQFWLGPWGKPFTAGVWQHFSIPVAAGSLGTSESQFFMDPYDNTYTSTETPIIYVDNIVLDTIPANAPGPSLKISKAVNGLNVFASTAGNYDRESVRLAQNTGKSWVGHASPSSPSTYSFTIKSFPNAPAYSAEAYLFLVPNPTGNDNAPDYSEANCIIGEVQSSGNGSHFVLEYKVNEAGNNAMFYGNPPYTNAPGSWDGVTTPWYETGNLGAVDSTILDGTYSLKFTSSSNITLITPDGSSTNLVISPYYANDFAESSGFDAYLGTEPNDPSAFNQAMVFSDFAVAGTVTPFSDNFQTDSTLNTTNWDKSAASDSAGILVVPASAPYWLRWTTPAAGFGLQTGSNLLDMASWTSPSVYPTIGLSGAVQQLVDSRELPSGGTAFFNLLKHTFTQLQVLLPGETNAPGTATGKIGTPTPMSLSNSGFETVTVNAVDSTYHIISGVSDTIGLTTSGGGAFLPNDAPMVNGTVTFSTDNTVAFTQTGTWTITASDDTNPNIPSATSSPVTVAN